LIEDEFKDEGEASCEEQQPNISDDDHLYDFTSQDFDEDYADDQG
jgi:hypothetical protein